MIGFILSLIGIIALCFVCLVVGAVMFALGAYEIIKGTHGEQAAKEWLALMKNKGDK